MKNRIERKFRELKAHNKKALVCFITAGDPDLKTTGKLVLALEQCGADIIELGVPFSDPMADGETIQAASQRALKKGVNLKQILQLVAQIRETSSMPLVLMTYYNPVLRYGEKRLMEDCGKSGVDGIIIPDLPAEESPALIKSARKNSIATIFFVSPTSTPQRIQLANRFSRGFIYYVSLTGVTGARKGLAKDIRVNLRRIKKICDKPVCVGFGISTPEQVRQVAKFSDGVIVGSAIVKKIEQNLGNKKLVEKVCRLVKQLAAALD